MATTAEANDAQVRISPGGSIVLGAPLILERRANGRPKTVVVNADQVEKYKEVVGGNPRVERRIGSGDRHVYEFNSGGISGLSVAAHLKSILVSFDIAYNHSVDSWVRRGCSSEARSIVEAAARLGRLQDRLFHRLAWGHLADARLESEVRALFDRACVQRHSALDHQMVASGDRARRTLDVAWNVFGHDLVGFRISTSYSGPSFTHLLASSPIRGASGLGLVASPWPFGLPAKRGLCGVRFADDDPDPDLVEGVANRKLRAFDHASVLGRLHDTSHHPQMLTNWALEHRPRGTVEDLLWRYIVADYGAMKEMPAGLPDAARQILRRHGLGEVRIVVPEYPTDPDYVVEWADVAADAFVDVVSQLYERYGPPVIGSLLKAETKYERV